MPPETKKEGPEDASKPDATHQYYHYGWILDLATFLLVWAFVLVCPYTKVEESFALQATHDIMFYGPINLTHYDHFVFPGAVPRSFMPALFLSLLSSPVALPPFYTHLINKFTVQVVVRLVLGALTVSSLRVLRQAVDARFGSTVALWFGLIGLTEFHLMYYASRTLPNTFALVATNHAVSCWLHDHNDSNDKSSGGSRHVSSTAGVSPAMTLMIQVFAFTGIVLRAEIAVLAGCILLLEWTSQRLPLLASIQIGIQASAVSLAMTMAVDTYFWNEVGMWPELKSFVFNIVHGKSSEWGVEPLHAYFTIHLPKLAPLALPLCTYAMLLEKRVRRYIIPVVLYVALYSMLPHKEWRFVIYIVPLINMGAALGVEAIRKRISDTSAASTSTTRLFTAAWAGALAATLTYSLLQLYVSSLNYPGGEALTALHTLIPPSTHVNVHLDVATCMTGASLFGQRYESTWTYSKNESYTEPMHFLAHTHLITENVTYHGTERWSVLAQIDGYAGLKIVHPVVWWMEVRTRWAQKKWEWRPSRFQFYYISLPVKLHVKPLLYILQRK